MSVRDQFPEAFGGARPFQVMGPRSHAIVSGVTDPPRGSWQQTWRRWGSGSVLRGNAHYMLARYVGDDGPVALCGYRPDPRTTAMRPLEYLAEPLKVPVCPKCHRRKAKADQASSSSPVDPALLRRSIDG